MKYFNTDDNSLSHHGIRGQKWGVRRFQNTDGSLTPAGKKRFQKLIELDKQHEDAVNQARKAADEEHRYMRSKGYGKDENYKEEAKTLYAIDDKFKKIADKTNEEWKNHKIQDLNL